jgi:UDP-GlcNAc3NAcA epimerase
VSARPVVLTVVGARPQFIKAAVLSRVLAQQGRLHEIIVHTGQHYDDDMSASFFRELDIPAPARNLGVGSGPPGAQVGRMLERLEEVLAQGSPRMILLYGDTNSTVAGGLVGAYHHLAVAHVEAGLRSHNWRMPEEVNRVITDRLSALLFCPSEEARSNLANEGITEGVHIVGDVMYDAARYYAPRARTHAEARLRELDLQGDFVLATIHRAENTDDPEKLRAILDGFGRSPWPVLLPLHPRTRAALSRAGLAVPPTVVVSEPVGYLTMLGLEWRARAIVTDSGGVQKEAYFAGTPCLTARGETEWVETVAQGWNRLVGAASAAITEGLEDIATGRFPTNAERPDLYGDGHAGERIAQILADACEAS